jgi:hypothetical protein
VELLFGGFASNGNDHFEVPLPSFQFVECGYETPKSNDEHPEAEDCYKTHLLLHSNR